MELAQVFAAVAALRSKVGHRSDVYLSVDQRTSVSIYARGIAQPGGATLRIRAEEGDTFLSLLARAESEWEKHGDQHRRELVRNMALAIIEITAAQGRCSDAALRIRFARDDIEALGAEAVADANAIAANGPFEIATISGDNGAPDKVDEAVA